MKKIARLLAFVLVAAMMLSMTAFAANEANNTTWIELSIEDDEGTNGLPYLVRHSGESSHYLTEESPLLVEVVAIINDMYKSNKPSTDLWDFDSKAMKEILDEGLEAYADGLDAWETYVDKYYSDVNPMAGMESLKDLLKDQASTLGDLIPNVAHKISFKNEVEGDKKEGVTYTVTITRYNEIRPELEIGEDQMTPYILGYPDGTVRPEDNITRAEISMIFFRLLTEESREFYRTSTNGFSDCDADAWYNEAVSTMAAAGVLRGYTDGSFRPNGNVTRAEFVSVLTRLVAEGQGDLQSEYKGYFKDVAMNDWFRPAVELAYELDWARGDEGLFRPNDLMTRAEVMAMVNRVLLFEKGMHVDMNKWPDNSQHAWYYDAVQKATNGVAELGETNLDKAE